MDLATKAVKSIVTAGVLLAAFYRNSRFVSALIDWDPPIACERARAIEESVQCGTSIDVEFHVFCTTIRDQTVRRLTASEGLRHAITSCTVGIQMLAGRETNQRSITIPTAA